MEHYSVSEVIEQAVQTEKLGSQFYANMAERFRKNEELARLFQDLSAKEVKHEKTFARLKRLVSDSDVEGWEVVSQYLRAIVESAFFLGKAKSLTALGQIRSMAAAVDHALGFEKETLAYYYGIRDGLKDTAVIDRIIKEEKKHIIWLSSFKQNISR